MFPQRSNFVVQSSYQPVKANVEDDILVLLANILFLWDAFTVGILVKKKKKGGGICSSLATSCGSL